MASKASAPLDRLALEDFDRDRFRERLVEALVASGLDAKSSFLPPLFKMIDDTVGWYIEEVVQSDARSNAGA